MERVKLGISDLLHMLAVARTSESMINHSKMGRGQGPVTLSWILGPLGIFDKGKAMI